MPDKPTIDPESHLLADDALKEGACKTTCWTELSAVSMSFGFESSSTSDVLYTAPASLSSLVASLPPASIAAVFTVSEPFRGMDIGALNDRAQAAFERYELALSAALRDPVNAGRDLSSWDFEDIVAEMAEYKSFVEHQRAYHDAIEAGWHRPEQDIKTLGVPALRGTPKRKTSPTQLTLARRVRGLRRSIGGRQLIRLPKFRLDLGPITSRKTRVRRKSRATIVLPGDQLPRGQ